MRQLLLFDMPEDNVQPVADTQSALLHRENSSSKVLATIKNISMGVGKAMVVVGALGVGVAGSMYWTREQEIAKLTRIAKSEERSQALANLGHALDKFKVDLDWVTGEASTDDQYVQINVVLEEGQRFEERDAKAVWEYAAKARYDLVHPETGEIIFGGLDIPEVEAFFAIQEELNKEPEVEEKKSEEPKKEVQVANEDAKEFKKQVPAKHSGSALNHITGPSEAQLKRLIGAE